MKRRITIKPVALQFLYKLLSELGAITRAEARKQNVAFDCFRKQVIDFEESLNVIRRKYRKVKPEYEGKEYDQEAYFIADADQAKFNKEIQELEERKVTAEFDIESLSLLNRALDSLFERQAAAKEAGHGVGLKGDVAMRLVEEASAAIEAAQDA